MKDVIQASLCFRYSKEIHYCGLLVIILTCITEVILQLYPNIHLIFQLMLKPKQQLKINLLDFLLLNYFLITQNILYLIWGPLL